MTSKTRKRLAPVALLMAVAVIGAVAVAIALVGGSPQSVQAHGDSGGPNDCDTAIGRQLHDALFPNDPCPTPTPGPTEPPTTPEPAGDVTADGWSSSSNGSDHVTIIVRNAGTLDIDDSFVLVLEDDFSVPDSIPSGAIYFKQSGFPSQGARIYASAEVDSEDDGHAGDDAHTIRIYVPDMSPDDARVAGLADRNFGIVISKQSGIKNPGDAKNYPGDSAGFKVGYQILRGTGEYDSDNTMALPNVVVKPKVSLDDENNKRGYELTITGTGFNKNSSATAYVLKGQSEANKPPASCASPYRPRR